MSRETSKLEAFQTLSGQDRSSVTTHTKQTSSQALQALTCCRISNYAYLFLSSVLFTLIRNYSSCILNLTAKFLVEMAYVGLLAVLTSSELVMNMVCRCDIGLACTVVGFVCGLVLLPTVIDITEGYYCVRKALW